MSLSNQGVSDYQIPLVTYHENENFINKLLIHSSEAFNRYKIILLSQDSYQLTINGKAFFLSGPHILCLNNEDNCKFLDAPDKMLDIIVLHPSVLNSNFDLYSCDHPDDYSVSQLQDLFYFNIFMHTLSPEEKIHSFDSVSILNASQKFAHIHQQLASQDSYSWAFQARGTLLELLFMLVMPSTVSPEQNKSCSPLVIDILKYLEEHYSEKITLEDLTKLFNTNRTTLINEFKEATHLSPYRYLLQLRLNIASSLLRNTELPVDEICQRTGFNDLGYFSKTFKKERNLTPSEYRKLCSSLNC